MNEKEELRNLVRRISNFDSLLHSRRIWLIASFLHNYCNKSEFTVNDIDRCLKHLDLSPTIETIGILVNKPFVSTPDGYKLNWRTLDLLDTKFGMESSSKQVHTLLEELPSKLTITEEKQFLDEALTCYSFGAYRAAIVMCWNLAFYHLCNFILKDTTRLTDFNLALPKRYPKASITGIATFDDFSRLQQHEVLEVCNSAHLVSKNAFKILKEKLDRRNIAAHPSTVIITQLNADDYILDLINNVVLALH